MPAWVLDLPQKVSADGRAFPSTAPRHAGSTPDPSREVSWTHFLSGTQGKAGDGDTSPALPTVLAPKPAQNSSCLHFAQQAVLSAGCRAQGTGRGTSPAPHPPSAVLMHRASRKGQAFPRAPAEPVPKPQPGKTPSPLLPGALHRCSVSSTHVLSPPHLFPTPAPHCLSQLHFGASHHPLRHHSRNILLCYWGTAHFGILPSDMHI